MVTDTNDYLWIVILGAFASFSASFGIGCNDVANAFASSVGSKALTIKQACVLAVIGEFLGATFLGGEVVKTIRKGIVDESFFADNPPLLMWGCFSVLLAVSLWLLLATKLELPVSTTHSTIGGMIGMGIAANGVNSVKWYVQSDNFPFAGGFVGVIISWFLSPIASGIVSCALFYLIRTFIMRSKDPFQRVIYVYPFFVALCVSIISMFMLMKGIKSSSDIKNLSLGVKLGISFGIGCTISICLIPLYKYLIKRIKSEKFDEESIEAKNETNEDIEQKKSSISTTYNTNIHEIINEDKSVLKIHENVEKFDNKTEKFFVYLQIFSAFFDSIAHGSNDVANAMGPFATIYVVFNTGIVSSKSDMGDNKYWILALGGLGICLGLLLYGYKIMRAIGVKLAAITPSRGFSIEMGSSLIVIIGSYNKWPLSTTHCQVGSTCGVALLDGIAGINKYVLLKTIFGWIITCFIVGSISALIFSFGAYSPSIRETCTNYTI